MWEPLGIGLKLYFSCTFGCFPHEVCVLLECCIGATSSDIGQGIFSGASGREQSFDNKIRPINRNLGEGCIWGEVFTLLEYRGIGRDIGDVG